MHQEITEIVSETLRCPDVSPDRDLFDMGATSLAFVRIIAQVNERYGVELTGSELGDTATVNRLAEVVRSIQDGTVTSDR